MNTIARSVAAGLLLGVALFLLPFFLLRVALFVLLIGGAFRLIRGRRSERGGFGQGWHKSHWQGRRAAFADRIRTMTDEEYATFKQQPSIVL
jgi:hypothetical protein